MGLITENDGAMNGYEAVELPPDPVVDQRLSAAIFRRPSALPSRRAVLYPQCLGDSFVPEDLASWYTARGFHFYVADLRPPGHKDQADGSKRPRRGRQNRKALAACFAGLDLASVYLREVDGVGSLIVSAHGAGAVTAALWCDARRDKKPADALILASPAFRRRQRRPLDIACPVLIVTGPGSPGDWPARDASSGDVPRRAGRKCAGFGAHVTWLHLAVGPAAGAEPASRAQTADGGRVAADRRRFFDEMGRWLGAYMYGQVRDQLL